MVFSENATGRKSDLAAWLGRDTAKAPSGTGLRDEGEDGENAKDKMLKADPSRSRQFAEA